MYWTNYHSHCKYCDGTDIMEKYLHEAIIQKVKGYGFSSHAPLPFDTKWAMNYASVSSYLEKASYLKDKFRDLLQVYIGLEVDFIPGVIGPRSSFIQSLKMDYVIGVVHFVECFEDGHHWEIDGSTSTFKEGLKKIFKNDIRKAVKRYYELIRQMIVYECPEIVGHLDKIKVHNTKKIFFQEEEPWYRKEVLKTLQIIQKAGCILEVNTRSLYKKKLKEAYPSNWILEYAYEMKIPVMLNSDAHHPEEITRDYEKMAHTLNQIGFTELRVLLDGKWQNRSFNRKGIEN